ncbi:MAG TPA: SirB2 family protein [Burkholderiales bacterium]
MSLYLFVKYVHVGCVLLSLAGFAARGALMLRGSPLLQARFVRVAPHVVDTLLLASALWLAWMMQQYPFVHGWLTAKVLGLLAYIILGSIALRRGHTRAVRLAALAGALLAAGYVVAVALTKNPLPL